MRILKRGGRDPLPPLSNISLKVKPLDADARPLVAGAEAAAKPVYRNEALEKLSKAAREALSAQANGTRGSG